jgi:hypothetical protein
MATLDKLMMKGIVCWLQLSECKELCSRGEYLDIRMRWSPYLCPPDGLCSPGRYPDLPIKEAILSTPLAPLPVAARGHASDRHTDRTAPIPDSSPTEIGLAQALGVCVLMAARDAVHG